MRNLKGGLEIPLSRRIFAHNTPRNCLRFMFTPSLPNHAGCQIDLSRNNVIIFILPLSRSEICPITPSRFPHVLSRVHARTVYFAILSSRQEAYKDFPYGLFYFSRFFRYIGVLSRKIVLIDPKHYDIVLQNEMVL